MNKYKITIVASFLEMRISNYNYTILNLWGPLGYTVNRLLSSGIGEEEFIIYESVRRTHQEM